MKKKSIKGQKKVSHTSSKAAIKLHYVVIFFGLVVLVLGSAKMYQKPHVLGASVLLAQGGDDSGGSSGGGDSGSSGGGSTPGGGNTSGSASGASGSSEGRDRSLSSGGSGGSSVSQNAVSDSTKVDCVGPDGRHFTTDFKDCFELNNAWHKSHFSFTPLSTTNTVKQSEQEAPEVGKIKQDTEKSITNGSAKLEVKLEGNNKKLELNQEGTKVELHIEDGKVVVKAKKEDGTETKLESKDALAKINESLSEQGVEVGTDEAKGLLIRKGEVEAHTQFPLSVDPITHELTITTPAGTKTVAVLPDQAVENLLSSKVLSSIENTTQTTASGTATLQNVTLTTQDNEPVFTVNGAINKKVLGLLPVSFAKQITVSAETGKVLKTNEAFISRLLEALSF